MPDEFDRRSVAVVDAFTDEPLSGNPAGVVTAADDLDDEQMQAIASELNASETVFLSEATDATRRVRFFTPTTEVELCGHATIAGCAFLAERGLVDAGEHTLATETGTVDVEIESAGRVWMTQDRPEIDRVDLDHADAAAALGVDVAALEDVGQDLPIARCSTGLSVLVVPVNFLEHLGDLEPDMHAIEELTDEHDATGVYAFTFDTLAQESTLHGRMFAPEIGVPEDPVTGTASGAVGAYLREFDAFDAVPDEMIFEQGHFVDRPGTVYVRVGAEVEVGGRAVTTLDGDIVVPASESDDIIEAE